MRGATSDLFQFQAGDLTVLVPIEDPTVVAAAVVDSSKPVSAEHADRLVSGVCLQRACLFDVAVLEVLMPNNSKTFGKAAVNSVLATLDPSNNLLTSCLADPLLLEAFMSGNFAMHHTLTFPAIPVVKSACFGDIRFVGG
jgi:hypothetical protein